MYLTPKSQNCWIVSSAWNNNFFAKNCFLWTTCEFGMKAILAWAYSTLEKGSDVSKMEWVSTSGCTRRSFTEISASVFSSVHYFFKLYYMTIKYQLYYFSVSGDRFMYLGHCQKMKTLEGNQLGAFPPNTVTLSRTFGRFIPMTHFRQFEVSKSA